MVTEINWGNFRAKFNGKEHKTFEWLCALLFYKEHGQPTGALRYRNQAGIEADPITVGKDVVGWQAKFLDSKISDHKAALKAAIDKAKKENPTLTHIFFYLNVDFDPSSKSGMKDPPYKTEIEEYATLKGIRVTWRTAGFFETPFVCEQNANLTKHFFTLGQKSVIDFVIELARHTEAILDPIRSDIAFNGKTIKLDRLPFTKVLQDTISRSPLVVVSGEAGVGKTAVIKDLYTQVKDSVPFFVFKAHELNISNVNELFCRYGSFTLSDLVQEFQDTEDKYIVIDSAEKLSDVERPEVLQELLSTLRNAGWKIIFTTRLSYLDDLKNSFIQIYGVSFEPINIPNLTSDELVALSKQYEFTLPQSERLKTLLQKPFYLNEYLQNYPAGQATISYTEFKDAIWNKQIVKSSYRKNNTHRKREDCFLEIARKRANSGNFFVTVERFDGEILQQLEFDEIIKFDSSARGYFITHDIYEEWALVKIIEQAFRQSADYEAFYHDIGSSLSIRRAFRAWLSEHLASNHSDIMTLIEATVESDRIDRHWKDEALVAVLLSDHAAAFINHFEQKLLELPKAVEDSSSSRVKKSRLIQYRYENTLFHRILFLLRIACKEIDQDVLARLGISKLRDIALSLLLTKPKGQGWKSLISVINKHKENLGLMYMQFILPVLDDWNRTYKQGDTTRDAGQVALFYYHELTSQEGFYFSSRDETKGKLVQTVLNASYELRPELTRIFEEVIVMQETSHRGRYYELVKTALSSLTESAEVARNLPTEVMKLANLFWFYVPKNDGWRSDYRNDIEQYFDLSSNHHDHYPASAFQTPTVCLLQSAPQDAVDFILSFTNKSIEYFAKSDFARNEVEEVKVFIDPSSQPINQYVSHRIWNIYRGTQVAPTLLESMHMALERWLLTVAKTAPPEELERWCLYLIRHSRSASITAVVASVVLAEPSKLFNVAQVLFRTKEFFFCDTGRMQLDMTARNLYSISFDRTGIFTQERLASCEDKHRVGHLSSRCSVISSLELRRKRRKLRSSAKRVYGRYLTPIMPSFQRSPRRQKMIKHGGCIWQGWTEEK